MLRHPRRAVGGQALTGRFRTRPKGTDCGSWSGLAAAKRRGVMSSDARMRAHLLSALHGLRNSNTGWVSVSDMNFGGLEPVSPGRILTVCEQLAEAGLIVFKPAPGGPDGGLVGMSKITGPGCDIVDGLAASRIALEFPQKKQPEPIPVASPAKPDLAGASLGAQS